jgi:hypothetical protein
VAALTVVRKVPSGPWPLVWLLALCVVAAGVAALEAFVRARDFAPSVQDDKFLWAWSRAAVADGRRDTLALLGASRIQLGISMSVLRRELPGFAMGQLALDGKWPAATLRDLAGDPRFRGVALVDMDEPAFSARHAADQLPWVTAYASQHRNPGAMLNRRLASVPQARLALLNATGRPTLESLVRDWRWRDAPYVVMRADRSRSGDYRMLSAQQLDEKRRSFLPRKEAGITERSWVTDASGLRLAVAAIRARGGEVVFLRMPTTGDSWKTSERLYPRRKYWDRVHELTGAITIHFKDHPGLGRFACPDWSHLDKRDAPAFTRALLDVLRRSGVLPAAQRAARPESSS